MRDDEEMPMVDIGRSAIERWGLHLYGPCGSQTHRRLSRLPREGGVVLNSEFGVHRTATWEGQMFKSVQLPSTGMFNRKAAHKRKGQVDQPRPRG